MIITDEFVMLNYPKTGSSFARKVLKELHRQRIDNRTFIRRVFDRLNITRRHFLLELMLPDVQGQGVDRKPGKHGTYTQIPMEYKDRTVVSIVRNPYSRFMSGYEFRWWAENPPIRNELITQHFPTFPDISLDDFVRLLELTVIHLRYGGKKPMANVGNLTIQFIKMFFKSPDDIIENLTDEYIDSEKPLTDIADIEFLQQESLDEDLIKFLLKQGYSEEELAFIRIRERENVTISRGVKRDDLWTKNALAYIAEKERLIFRILESKGISYGPPDESKVLRTFKE